MKTQTDETIHNNIEASHIVHTISNEEGEKRIAEAKRERRLRNIRRYLKERAKRSA